MFVKQGTTGKPKAATLSHFNVVNNAIGMAERMGFTKEVLLHFQGKLPALFFLLNFTSSQLVFVWAGPCFTASATWPAPSWVSLPGPLASFPTPPTAPQRTSEPSVVKSN